MPSVHSPVDQVKRKRAPSSSSTDASTDSRSVTPPPSRRRRSVSPRAEQLTSKAVVKHNNESDKIINGNTSPNNTEEKGDALRKELAKLSGTRAGGAYVPPARLRALMAEAAAADPGSIEYQRMSWDALKKSVTGLVNKVAIDNIKFIVPELFGGANLVRGRGLFCRSIMKAQALSLPFTPVFASLVAIVNTKLPMVGELLVTRLVNQFRRSFKRNDKTICHATSLFLAHLVNQRVVHEILALEMLVLLLENPTDDSVELAVGFMREIGAFLSEESPRANNSVFDRFRAVLYEGAISKRVQYMIEVLSQVRRDNFKDNPRIPEGLDLVEEDDQITHQINLDDQLNVEEGLNVFKPDPQFVEHEEQYKLMKAEILGENESSDSDVGTDAETNSEEQDDEDEEDDEQAQLDIHDQTQTNLINLRRTIYLTIMSAAVFEEAVHKLLKINIPEGQEIEMCNMIVECCSQERTFNKFFARIGERFCKLNRMWSECFERCFHNYYDTIHRYETNRLRNIARFFGALIASDSISWACFEAIHLNEDDTTSSSRIFTKILFQEMNEILGIKDLVQRFNTPEMQPYFGNMFPLDNPKNTRFSINYFTSIGLGPLTEGMREHLKNAPKLIMQQRAALGAGGSGDDDSSSSDTDSSLSTTSSSLSDSSNDYSSSYDSRRSRSRTPPRRRYSRRSPSVSRTPSSVSRSVTPSSRSPSPPPRRRRPVSPSPTPSPPPRRRTPPASVRRPQRDAFSPDRRDGRRTLPSRTPPSRSVSRSVSPPQRPYRGRPQSRSPSRSPASFRSSSFSPPPSHRRSPPPRPRYDDDRWLPRSRYSERSPPPHLRRSYGDERKRPRSPLPPSRRRYDDDVRRPLPPPPSRARYADYSPRSPPQRARYGDRSPPSRQRNDEDAVRYGDRR